MKEVIPLVLVLATVVVLATYARMSEPNYYIFKPLDTELKEFKVLEFRLRGMSIRERTGYDHVVGVFIRKMYDRDVLGITYWFENKTCSDGIEITQKLETPEDWSYYDRVIIDVFGDMSNNTIQFWYIDALHGRGVLVGQVTLDWFGWKRLEFDIIPLEERRSVSEFKIVILHYENSPVYRNYTVYISNPMFIENLKGKLNIVYRGFTSGDYVYAEFSAYRVLEIEYEFTSKESHAVFVDRWFVYLQDFSKYDVLEVDVFGDKSNNTIQFWYQDEYSGLSVCIGSTMLDWEGWKRLTFELPKEMGRHVAKFSIVIVYGQSIENEKIVGKEFKSSGVVMVKEPILRKTFHLERKSKLIVIGVYLLAFVA